MRTLELLCVMLLFLLYGQSLCVNSYRLQSSHLLRKILQNLRTRDVEEKSQPTVNKRSCGGGRFLQLASKPHDIIRCPPKIIRLKDCLGDPDCFDIGKRSQSLSRPEIGYQNMGYSNQDGKPEDTYPQLDEANQLMDVLSLMDSARPAHSSRKRSRSPFSL